jgi:hypothetical protein
MTSPAAILLIILVGSCRMRAIVGDGE